MSRKLYTLLSLVLILSFALTACGAPATEAPPAATEAPASTKAPAATEASAATEAPAGEPVTISVMANRIGTQAELLEQLTRKFEQENPDIKVEFSAPGSDYEKLMKIKMAANDMPDVFATHGWAKIRYGEFLLDLRDQPWATQLDPAIKPAVTDDSGKVYVLPMDQEKTGPAFNADILKQYGVEVPLTWTDFMAACETIRQKVRAK